MILLLDTHTILWFFRNDPQLSSTAKTAIEEPANRKFVSIASCWEIAIKAAIGKLSLGEPSGVLLPREISKNNFDLLNISLAHATTVENLPPHHKDPFDRLLVAQAQIENVSIVSADVIFDSYGIPRIW